MTCSDDVMERVMTKHDGELARNLDVSGSYVMLTQEL